MPQFKLTRPCANCPFRKGQGQLFQLGRPRVEAIFEATAFQCHKTIDYEHEDDPRKRQGEHPQQCAGLMSLLHREGQPNQIMQVGQRMGFFDPAKLDHSECYGSMAEALEAHEDGR